MKAGSIALTGDELDRMDDKQLDEVIENCRVFARVTPEHKLRIVKAFKSRGHVCAMTGDGVNDAPAIKRSRHRCINGNIRHRGHKAGG